ncbi:hypothetical protein ACOQFL_10350 [Actinopolyspora sp. H202]|uniref:hypothetical protein n=1 Tax=Actinopolyspora sp. H202 TaxID=1500456 RepID=UPI003EE613F8
MDEDETLYKGDPVVIARIALSIRSASSAEALRAATRLIEDTGAEEVRVQPDEDTPFPFHKLELTVYRKYDTDERFGSALPEAVVPLVERLGLHEDSVRLDPERLGEAYVEFGTEGRPGRRPEGCLSGTIRAELGLYPYEVSLEPKTLVLGHNFTEEEKAQFTRELLISGGLGNDGVPRVRVVANVKIATEDEQDALAVAEDLLAPLRSDLPSGVDKVMREPDLDHSNDTVSLLLLLGEYDYDPNAVLLRLAEAITVPGRWSGPQRPAEWEAMAVPDFAPPHHSHVLMEWQAPRRPARGPLKLELHAAPGLIITDFRIDLDE